MHRFVKSCLTEWRRLELPFDSDTVVLAVSGGADSLSLLLAMHALREERKQDLRLVTAHFNHGLRGVDSDRDESFVRKIASDLKVEFAFGRAKPIAGGNIEQNARNARYQFLEKIAENVHASAIVTGHTINDQAETFLINLLRGSGPGGLSGMKPVRALSADCGVRNAELEKSGDAALRTPHSALKLVRPLLTWAKRGDTEQFCRDMGVEYCCDTMNEDTAFKRVRIRKILLPLLEDFNPNIVEVLANTALLLSKTTKVKEIENRIGDGDELYLGDIVTQGELEMYERIRDWLSRMRGNSRRLGLKHIKAIARLALSEKSGRVAEIPGGRVVKSGGRLRYEDNKVEKTVPDN